MANIHDSFTAAEKKFEVKHKVVDFQKVTLGEKIRQIYSLIEGKNRDVEEMGTEDLNRTSLEDFDYTFNNLRLAQMML